MPGDLFKETGLKSSNALPRTRLALQIQVGLTKRERRDAGPSSSFRADPITLRSSIQPKDHFNCNGQLLGVASLSTHRGDEQHRDMSLSQASLLVR